MTGGRVGLGAEPTIAKNHGMCNVRIMVEKFERHVPLGFTCGSD